MNKECYQQQIKALGDIISPYQTKLNELKSTLEMVEYNEFREDVQKEIEILQEQLPHLGKFYFEDEYDDYDGYSFYYIYYQNEATKKDEKCISKSRHRIWGEYGTKYTFYIDREPYNVWMNRMIGRGGVMNNETVYL